MNLQNSATIVYCMHCKFLSMTQLLIAEVTCAALIIRAVCLPACLSICLSICSGCLPIPSVQALTGLLLLQQLTAQFAKEYEEKTGQAVKFRLSFGGSGTQARAVVDGLPGDMGQPLFPMLPAPPPLPPPSCAAAHYLVPIRATLLQTPLVPRCRVSQCLASNLLVWPLFACFDHSCSAPGALSPPQLYFPLLLYTPVPPHPPPPPIFNVLPSSWERHTGSRLLCAPAIFPQLTAYVTVYWPFSVQK